jgi:hypothetical protein
MANPHLEKTLDLLKNIEDTLPLPFPDEDYRKEVCRYGRRRLVDALVNEARLRFEAEQALADFGFRLNSYGMWERQKLAEINANTEGNAADLGKDLYNNGK